jgi:GNAT superfamily N-acetyltransferase
VALDLATAIAGAPGVPGIAFVTRAERPGLEGAMYAVAVEAEADIPSDQPAEVAAFPDWRAVNLDRPGRRPELTFLALAGDEVAGFAILHAGPGTTCYHGLTAVARAWRGRGIARALKERQIGAARQAGFAQLVTENEARNAPIRHLNDVLGYTPRGATLFLSGPAAAIRPRS